MLIVLFGSTISCWAWARDADDFPELRMLMWICYNWAFSWQRWHLVETLITDIGANSRWTTLQSQSKHIPLYHMLHQTFAWIGTKEHFSWRAHLLDNEQLGWKWNLFAYLRMAAFFHSHQSWSQVASITAVPQTASSVQLRIGGVFEAFVTSLPVRSRKWWFFPAHPLMTFAWTANWEAWNVYSLNYKWR